MDKPNEKLINELKDVLSGYLDVFVKEPSLQTIDEDVLVQQVIVSILVILKISRKLVLNDGSDIDFNSLRALSKEERDKRILLLEDIKKDLEKDNTISTKGYETITEYHTKKHLFSYLEREINWICISILSASYISSMILMRSVFELLIGIATNKTGSMRERIDSINYLSTKERRDIKKDWKTLNAWTHPFRKWEKEVCPVYIDHKPLYHPELYKECISKLKLIIDLLLIISIGKFSIAPRKIMGEMKANDINQIISIDEFPLFSNRL
ncbi:MAG: hypothetical protein V3V92_06025 [Candidatus Hydrothermarchaeales archaeon]